MRLLLITVLISASLVSARSNVKALTESMGQEVIEIGSPIKDLPGDIEEEPSAEVDDDNSVTTATVRPATKQEPKKTLTTTGDALRKMKDIDVIDGGKDDEEMKIEKELADLYKDNADYKADSAEAPSTVSGDEKEEKPVIRQRSKEFNFQPNSNSLKDIERFRTSIDEISCSKGNKKKLANIVSNDVKANTAASFVGNLYFISIISASMLVN